MPDKWQRAGVEYIVKDSTRHGTAGVLRQLDRLESASRGLVASVGRVGGAVAGALGVGSLAGLTVLVKRQMEAVDATAKWSDRLGIGTERLIGLQHSAELSGVGVNQLNLALQRSTRRIAEAAQGSGEAQDALRELGLDATALARKAPDEAFLDIADAMGDVTNQSDRVRLAFKLFDSEGVAMVNILKAGRTGIEAMMQDAEDLGLTLSRLDAAQIEAANHAITRAKGATAGLARQIAVDLAPYIEGIADQFTEAAVSGQDFGDTLVTALEATALAAGEVYDVLSRVVTLFGKLPAAKKAAEDAGFWRTLNKQISDDALAEYEFSMKQSGRDPWNIMGRPLRGYNDKDLYDRIRTQVESRYMAQMARDDLFGAGGILPNTPPQAVSADSITSFFEGLRQKAAERRAEQQRRLAEQLAGQAGTANTEGAMEGPGGGVTPIDYEVLDREVNAWIKTWADEQQRAAQEVTKAQEAVDRLDRQLETSIEVTARMADGHQYAADQVAYEQAVWAAYGDDVETATAKIAAHKDKLAELENEQKKVSASPLLSWADVARQGLDDLSGTLTDVAFDFRNAEKYAEQFVEQLARMAMQELVMRPLLQSLGSAVGLTASAHGNVFGTDGVMAFARGTVVRRPTLFPFADGVGLMGEAGPEAVMPLARDSHGNLGVRAETAQPLGRTMTPKLSINIRNESGSPIAADDVTTTMTPDEYVIGILLRDHAQGGRTRDLMRGGR